MAKTVPIQEKEEYISEYFTTDIDGKDEHSRQIRLLQEYKFATDQLNTISVLNLDGLFTYVNDEHCNVSGYKKEEIIGKHYVTIMHPDVPNEILENICRLLLEKKSWKGVINGKNKNNEPYWLKTKIIPVFDIEGNAIECISIGHDITQRHLREEELCTSFTRLLELDEKKDKFINIVSHELRTPMTAITGYISMVLDGDAGEINQESRIYLERAYKSSRRLLSLINEMLDLSELGLENKTIQK